MTTLQKVAIYFAATMLVLGFINTAIQGVQI